MKKKLIIGGVIIIVIILGVIFIGPRWGNWWQRYQTNKILREYATLDEAYRNDNYGSPTPEGTLALFVDALKQGDADLASKYFVVEKREEYKKAVSNWIRLGKAEEIAVEISKANGNGKVNSPIYQMSSVGMSNIVSLVINFNKNEYSQKWLIESL